MYRSIHSYVHRYTLASQFLAYTYVHTSLFTIAVFVVPIVNTVNVVVVVAVVVVVVVAIVFGRFKANAICIEHLSALMPRTLFNITFHLLHI